MTAMAAFRQSVDCARAAAGGRVKRMLRLRALALDRLSRAMNQMMGRSGDVDFLNGWWGEPVKDLFADG